MTEEVVDTTEQTNEPTVESAHKEVEQQELKNYGDLKKAIEARDRWKRDALENKKSVDDLTQKVQKLEIDKQKQGGDLESLVDLLSDENDTVKTENVTLKTELSNIKNQLRAKKFADETLKDVNPAYLKKASTILKGLASDGEITLLPDDESMATEAEKARNLLTTIDSSLFADAARAPGAPTNLPGANLQTTQTGRHTGVVTISQKLRNKQ